MLYPDRVLPTTHIGSFPYVDVSKALEMAFKFDIPAWPQLPKFKEEGMLWQFMRSFPCFDLSSEKVYTNTQTFEEELLSLYERYVAIVEEGKEELLEEFLERDFSKSFFPFLELAKREKRVILKGQITGPFTLGTAITTESGEALIFRDDLRDLLIRYLTLKALAQVKLLSGVAEKVILFIDEPGLAGFGSSAYISLSKELILEMLRELISKLKTRGVLVGIHVCANTAWDLVLESGIDVLSFDSYSYFERVLIYAQELERFLKTENGYLAWGAIPTDSQQLSAIEEGTLLEKFRSQLSALSGKINLSPEEILQRSILTPACGMGSLGEEEVEKVIHLLNRLQSEFGA